MVLVAVIGALYLAQASRTAAAGRTLQDLTDRRQVLDQQNAQLRAEIASLRSVPRLAERAEAMGYRIASAEDVEYIYVEDLPQNSARPVLPEAENSGADLPIYQESLESWLTQRFSTFSSQFRDFWQGAFGTGTSEEAGGDSSGRVPGMAEDGGHV